MAIWETYSANRSVNFVPYGLEMLPNPWMKVARGRFNIVKIGYTLAW
jgi:hypothetical protein